MTLCDIYSDAVKAWLRLRGPVPCTNANGKIPLVDLLMTCYPNISRKVASRRVSNHISQFRGTIICPQHTTNKYSQKEIGEGTSNCPEVKKEKNDRNAAKKKQERWEAAFAYQKKHGKQVPLNKAQIEEKAQDIINNTDIGGLGTLAANHTNPGFTFYAGLTKQLKKEDEDLRFLTKRGGNGRYKTNRPVLLHADNSIIKMKTARDNYGFRSIVVYESSILLNTSGVEDAIQTHFKDLPLGYRKLWRCVAKGKSSDEADVEEKEVYKVFITYSTQVFEELHARTLKIQHGEPRTGEKRSHE